MQDRFDRFKAFVSEQLPGHPVNMALSMLGLNQFLSLIALQLPGLTSDADLPTLVLARLAIDPAAFDESAVKRFGLYCEYFAACARASA